jgi:hypothetical protein
MCNIQLGVTNNSEIAAACKLLAHHYYGQRGTLAYESFDHINAAFFAGHLPTPNIQWLLTPYGNCLASTGIRKTPNVPPVVVLHVALLGAGPTRNPWGIDRKCLGARYAYETLLHECIHISVHYLLGGNTGESSHNSPEWISEVNRIAPMIGLNDVRAAMSKPKRVIVEGEFTRSGKPTTTVQRVTVGNVPFKAAAAFPSGVRKFLGDMSVYEQNALPFACSAHDYNGGR